MKLFTDRNIRTLFLIGLGIYFIVEHGTRERPESTKDLFDLNGSILEYSFKDNAGWRGTGHQYYLFLDEYPNKFQVKADYLRYFNKLQFEQNFKPGNQVKLSVFGNQEHLIGTEEAVFLTSLSVNGFEYLSKKEAIKFEMSSAASNSDYILGIVFILLGILVFVFYERIKKATNKTYK